MAYIYRTNKHELFSCELCVPHKHDLIIPPGHRLIRRSSRAESRAISLSASQLKLALVLISLASCVPILTERLRLLAAQTLKDNNYSIYLI